LPQIEILPPHALDPVDHDRWAALCADETAFASPLLGPDFARLVGSVRTDTRVAILRRRGEGLAFFPFHQRPNGMARPVGAPFSDIHAVISGPEPPLTGPEFLRRAGIRRFPFSSLADPFGLFAGALAAQTPNFAIDLTAPPPLERSAHHRKKLRQWRTRLEAEYGPITLTAPDHDPEAFESLQRWKRAQFNRSGLHDVLRPDWSRTLMGAAFARRAPPLRGFLATLRAGGRLVAGRFGVEAGGVFHPWLAAYDLEFAAFGPGHLLLAAIMEAGPDLPLTLYELGPGMEREKRSRANVESMLFSGELRTDSGRTRLPANGKLLRLGRRLDQIATVELTLSGRAFGVADALLKAPRRWSAG
jgi:CelD/BcsL family acetyltransferase involved in cellulose biosynthesis